MLKEGIYTQKKVILSSFGLRTTATSTRVQDSSNEPHAEVTFALGQSRLERRSKLASAQMYDMAFKSPNLDPCTWTQPCKSDGIVQEISGRESHSARQPWG